eukprot:1177776-Prorocentrum_minimum.AAC.1
MWRVQHDLLPVELAEAAMRRADVAPIRSFIRGGTDGAQLTARGLPTPNLFAGWHNAHGPLEWASLNEMLLSLRTVEQLLHLYTEQ